MTDWIPMVVVPNAYVHEPVDMDHISLVPARHERVKAAARRQPRLRRFLRRFSDGFEQKIEPSVLMVKADAPDHFRGVAPVSGFRDALSISVITGGRAVMITHRSGMMRPVWSECLALYPWMLDKHGQDLITNNSSMMGMHDLERFHGQSIPAFHRTDIDEYDIDQILFDELRRRWLRRFDTEESQVAWEDRAVFRSLNMAYQACMMPGGQEASFYDVGRLIMLWASAFEILIHGGPGSGSGKIQVMDLLDNADWYDKRLSALTHEVRISSKTTQMRSLPSLLYSRIDALRSDFIHGNEVSQDQLVTNNETHFLHIAAILYRCALAAKLGIRRPEIEDDEDSPEGREFNEARVLSLMNQWSYWKDPQTRHERAILKAAGLSEGRD